MTSPAPASPPGYVGRVADGSGALRNNLPSDVTRFVGRRREIAAVRRLLGESRLITLTGLGGTGKTRLALKVGAEVGRSFSDGVWFVDLAEVRDPEVLPHSVTQALGLHSQAGRSPEQLLVDHLRDKRALLVVDNCEHLIDASAQLVNGLLQGCSSLHVLATSREAL
ncbi:MAG: hypothetical protein QOJ29_2590, partial [Thermoleophilaceae bacterium]|nr:hypothetical protein [Thermoleophilaceae bacterium]